MISKNFRVRPIVVMVGIYLVALFPLIRANYSYVDDIGRIYTGRPGWGYFSRYISELLSHVIHANLFYLADISPLTQLLAIGVLVVASVMVIFSIRGTMNVSLGDTVAVLPLGLSPYFLECISYKFDSPYMAISILASVFPLLFRKRSKFAYSFSIIVGMLVMCMTYQVASGIFPMLVVLLTFLMWCQGREGKKTTRECGVFVFQSAISYLAGVGIYFLFIMKHVDDYVSNGMGNFFEILSHYQYYCRLVWNDFEKGWLLLIILLTIWFICTAVIESAQNKVATFFLAMIAVFIMFLFSFGLYPLLKSPLFEPRAMYGFGAYMVCIGVGNQAKNRKRWCTRILTFMLSWCFVVFACAYGNSLTVQQEYEDFRVAEVIEDLTDIPDFYADNEKQVMIKGSVGLSPVLQNVVDSYEILERLIPITFRENWYWGTWKFCQYYELGNIELNEELYTGDFDN